MSSSGWNNYFHRDQAYDTTYNNNDNNAPMGEPQRLSYFAYKQEGSYGDVEKSTHNNPEDPSFWQTPGNEQPNVAPSAPPQESLYGSNLERGKAESDEEYARNLLREEHENYMRYSQGSMRQTGNTRGSSSYPSGAGNYNTRGSSSYPGYSGEAGNYNSGGNPMQTGVQEPPPNDTYYDPKIPKALMDPNVQRQLKKKKYWRPYFTYLVTLIQTAILISEFIYNQKLTGSIIQTNPFNVLIGPDASTTIRLGARFIPCMRPIPSVPLNTIFSCINRSLPDINSGRCTLEDTCGLGGFNNGEPHQWFRFITPIFLHGGVVHFLFNMLFQVQTGRQIESDMGSLRYGIIYMGSGIFGFIFGGNFSEPTLPSLGASGSLFGIIGVLLLELLQNWKLMINPCWELTKLVIMIVLTFLLGLLPFIDNFSHIGGFVMGILLGLVLMPTINFSKVHKRFNWSLRIIALPIAVVLFVLLIRNFYQTEDPAKVCPWCKYLDCAPILGWCDISGLKNVTTTPP